MYFELIDFYNCSSPFDHPIYETQQLWDPCYQVWKPKYLLVFCCA